MLKIEKYEITKIINVVYNILNQTKYLLFINQVIGSKIVIIKNLILFIIFNFNMIIVYLLNTFS